MLFLQKGFIRAITTTTQPYLPIAHAQNTILFLIPQSKHVFLNIDKCKSFLPLQQLGKKTGLLKYMPKFRKRI